MKYQLKELLNFENDNFTIHDGLVKYFDFSKIAINRLFDDLTNCKNKGQPYVYPVSNLEFAQNLKLLTYAGFLLCYEITKNDIFTINLQQFIDNNKFVTPDVFFFSFVILNEVLEKSQQNRWHDLFAELIQVVDKISQFDSEIFEANLEELKNLSNDKSVISFENIEINNSKENNA